MISNGKLPRLLFFLAALLFTAGCGGISASKSVSPLDFFMPGLLKAAPPATRPDQTLPVPPPANQVAQE